MDIANQNIEASKDGIKISYRHFLSDSATGYVVLFIGIISYFFPFFGSPLQPVLQITDSLPLTAFALLLLFLLATPLGLLINAFSWFFLGWLQIRLETLWVDGENILTDDTKKKYCFKESAEFLGASKNNWLNKTRHIKGMFDTYYPHVAVSLGRVKGVRIFMRNLAFISGLLSLLFFYEFSSYLGCHCNFSFDTIFLSVFFLFLCFLLMIVNSLVAFFQTTSLIFRSYCLCFDKKDELKGNLDGICKRLIEVSKENFSTKA